jgi:hypothetical protein
MTADSELDRIRQDFQARQRNIRPGDLLRKSIDYDTKVLPGRLTIACLFLILGAGIIAIPFFKNFEDGTTVAFIVAFVPLFLSYRLFRIALHHRSDERSNPSNGPQ